MYMYIVCTYPDISCISVCTASVLCQPVEPPRKERERKFKDKKREGERARERRMEERKHGYHRSHMKSPKHKRSRSISVRAAQNKRCVTICALLVQDQNIITSVTSIYTQIILCVVMSRCPLGQKMKVHHEREGSPASIAGSANNTLSPVTTPLNSQNQSMTQRERSPGRQNHIIAVHCMYKDFRQHVYTSCTKQMITIA